MQLHEQVEEGVRLRGRVVDGCQAFAQLGQQLGHQARELAGVRAGQLRLCAPEQGVYGLAVAARVGIARRVRQTCLGHDLDPGAEQKARNFTGNLVHLRQQPDLARHLRGQQVALLGVLQGFDGALAFAFARLLAFGPGSLQFLQNSHEGRLAVDVGGRQAAGDLEQRLHEAVESGGFGVGKRQAAVGDFLQQAAGGVLFVAEEPRVGQGQL